MKKLYIIFIAVIISTISFGNLSASQPGACVDIEFLFVRGSGAQQNASQEWTSYENAVQSSIRASHLSYRTTDLSYPAISVNNFSVLLSAYISAGTVGDFAASVSTGADNLANYYQKTNQACPSTKWVIFGYSQGAKVIAAAQNRLDAANIIYIATFGDPNLYLPEGIGFNPPACRKQKLSSYRVHAPNCDTDSGIFGARKPYFGSAYSGKVGLWCNDKDLICGSSRNLFINSGHLEYSKDVDIPSAVDLAMKKIQQIFPSQTIIIEKPQPTVANTAFVVNASSSMASSIQQYKSELIDRAAEIIRQGGRVALLAHQYSSITKICDLGCTISDFILGLNDITTSGADKTLQNLLAFAQPTLSALSWEPGAEQSVIVLIKSGLKIYPRTSPTPRPQTKSRALKTAAAPEPEAPTSPTIDGSSSVSLAWRNPAAAAYTLLIIDDVILGLLPSGTTNISITDLDRSKSHTFTLTSVDTSYNLGASTTLSLAAQPATTSVNPANPSGTHQIGVPTAGVR